MNNKGLLKFITCGSVDDGKSTLIGNLLFNSKKLLQDQIETLSKDSKKNKFNGNYDYSLLLDGLEAEREQGITIDVAYRYFETLKRKYIIADTPGHEQYTRNMVTAASNADLAVILIDASKGVQIQTKRHAFINSLLQIKYIILAINKMDLVDYKEEAFNNITQEFFEFSKKLDFDVIIPIPVSATLGDNVVDNSSPNTPWYKGESLLQTLDSMYIKPVGNAVDFRFPVQTVIRTENRFRGYAGRVESGSIKLGESIIVLPSKVEGTVKEIMLGENKLAEANTTQSVLITLNEDIDISRGDMIVRKDNTPRESTHIDSTVCWLSDTPYTNSSKLIFRQTTTESSCAISRIVYQIDINTLHRKKEVSSIKLNDICRVQIKTSKNIYFDDYKTNKSTGSFLLIDPITKLTVAAGMIKGQVPLKSVPNNDNIKWEKFSITNDERSIRFSNKGVVIWMTGLSGSGKSTIANNLEKELFNMGHLCTIIDGDNLRHGLNRDLGFSKEDRKENIRRAGEVAKLFQQNGFITICSFISPYKNDREKVRSLFENPSTFYEVFVKCDLETCKKRDPKGLYKKVSNGEIKDFTGVDAVYEEPTNSEIILDTSKHSIEEEVQEIIEKLRLDGNIW